MLSPSTMQEIAAYLHLISDGGTTTHTPELLIELLVSHHERRMSQLEAINALPLYPTEEILWDENIVPSEYYNGESKASVCEIESIFVSSLPHLTQLALHCQS